MTYKNLEIVVLTHDISEYGLKEGDTGTVVDVYEGGEAYEVEFMTDEGKTIALLTLNFADIKPKINLESHKSDEIINRSKISDLPFIYPSFIYPYT